MIHMSTTSTMKGLTGESTNVQGSLDYRMGSRPAWDTEKYTISNQTMESIISSPASENACAPSPPGPSSFLKNISNHCPFKYKCGCGSCVNF